jgi:hypothetical protein
LESAGVRPEKPFDGRVPVMTEEELCQALTITDEAMAAFKVTCEAAWAELSGDPAGSGRG